MFFKLVALFRAARLRQAEALFQDTDPSSRASKLLKHKKNYERMSRTINGIYAGLAVAAAECVPLGSTVVSLVALTMKARLFIPSAFRNPVGHPSKSSGLGVLQSMRLLFWFIERHTDSFVFAVMLSQRVWADRGIMATLSLISSWSQCSLKFGKLILLKDYLPYVLDFFVASLV